MFKIWYLLSTGLKNQIQIVRWDNHDSCSKEIIDCIQSSFFLKKSKGGWIKKCD